MNDNYTTKFRIPVLPDDHSKKIIGAFLNGDLTTRQAGEALNMSHQGIINLVCSLARKWYQDGEIKKVY